MPQKWPKPNDIVAKLRPVDMLVSQGRSLAEAVRLIGVTSVARYRRPTEFGGLKTDLVDRLALTVSVTKAAGPIGSACFPCSATL